MFRLVLLTTPAALPDEPRLLAELLALPSSPHRLHLRKPGWSAAQVEALIQALPTPVHPRLVLHAYPHLVRHYRLGGLHLTGSQRAAARCRPLLLPGQTLSTSFHSLAEIRRARRRYEYVFLSPIFDSISKADYVSQFDLPALQAGLHQLAARPGYWSPVLALGGINSQNTQLVRQLGFAGAAVLGAVWQSPDPVAAWRAYASAASQSFHTGS